MARYIPPPQSKLGQIVDVVVLLVLTVGALYIPLWLGLAGSALETNGQENPTWESLSQNPEMVGRWAQLGYPDPAAAAEIITPRFDYSFSILALLLMITAIVTYYVILLKFSEKEYREVISEKFGDR
jgi:hypothetical protein